MAIIGKFENIKENFRKSELFYEIISYFESALNPDSKIHKRLCSLELGAFDKVELNSEMFALEQCYLTRDREFCFIESHEKYIDFQLIVKGAEVIEHCDISSLRIDQVYNSQKDLIVYEMCDSMTKILLPAGHMGVFFPYDAHLGCGKYLNSEKIIKTVIKLPVRCWYDV
jgi:YhcH/YjgK/YiaL family protein